MGAGPRYQTMHVEGNALLRFYVQLAGDGTKRLEKAYPHDVYYAHVSFPLMTLKPLVM